METGESIDLESVSTRHRQEKKELQAKVTALKKNVPKNDKKKKKEIMDMVNKLETDLAEKHRLELEPTTVGGEVVVEEKQEVDEIIEDAVDEGEPEIKLTRAQRRRNKKELEDKERDKRISEQEKVNRKGPRNTELTLINENLKTQGLVIHNVPADGNCLYCSIQHQLDITERESMDVAELREQTADFMRENKDDFLPFMCNDSDDPVDEEQFEKYCKDVAKTKLWGGQLELRALSNILKCPIKVIQASGPATIQGEQFEGPPLILTYHRHLYRLGEHYNSTIAHSDNKEES